MKKMLFVLVGTLIGFSQAGLAKTDGLLLIGPHDEVRSVLKRTRLEVDIPRCEHDLAAVKLADTQVTVYECGAVEEIVEFVGGVVEEVVAFTLETGTELWELIENLGGEVWEAGKAVAKAMVTIVKKGLAVVKNGATLVAATLEEVFELLTQFLKDVWEVVTP